MQPDSLIPDPSNPQAWNRYSYVGNNPINFNDPTGHFACGDGETKACGTGKKQDPILDPYKLPKPKKNPKDGGLPETPYDGPCVSVVCLPPSTTQPTLPTTPTIPTNVPNYNDSSTTFDDLVNYWKYSFKAHNVLHMFEQAENYGRPIYKQVKYSLPLGGYEYGIDAAFQVYDDWGKNLNFSQRLARAVIRGGESAVTDGGSILIGGVAAAALQASVPVPLVPAGVGYFVGALSASTIIDTGFTNKLNPILFNYFGGQYE